MTLEENKEIVLRLGHAQEQGDMDEWVNLWAPDARNHGRPVTPELLRLLFTSLRTAFPDRRHEIVQLIADGDLVVSYMVISGTFGQIPPLPVDSVDFLTAAPTGTPYSVHAVHIWRTVDGKIAEHWAVRDDLDLLVQFGAITPPQRIDTTP